MFPPDNPKYLPAYFKYCIERDKNSPILITKNKPCADCPVVNGFYTSISEALSQESKEIQESISEKWFCHTDRSLACKGNMDYLKGKHDN